MLHKVASGQVLPPHRSGPLTPLLLRMLAPDPAARPAMLDVAHTLTALHADAAAGASAPTRQMGSAPSEAGGTTERMAPAGAALLGAAALPGTAALPVQAASGNPPPTVRPPASPGRPPGNPDRGPNTRLIALAVALTTQCVAVRWYHGACAVKNAAASWFAASCAACASVNVATSARSNE